MKISKSSHHVLGVRLVVGELLVLYLPTPPHYN